MRNNIYNIRLVIVSFLLIGILSGCESFLEEEVHSQYDPDKFLQDQKGVDALLTGVYSSAIITGSAARNYFNILGEFPTDIAWETGGGLNRSVVPIMNFTWDPSSAFINGVYSKFYEAIARANNVLNVAKTLSDVKPETIDQINAEARFVRAFSYYILHNIFGPTPIIEIPEGASIDEIERIGKETPKATEEAYRAYVEADFLYAANILETAGLSSRANKGSALGMLCKFHLNNKEWTKAADAAQKVLALGYTLYPDYTTLFSVDGENNSEYIFRFETLPNESPNIYMPHAYPPSFVTNPPNATNYGAQFRTYTAFYETFENQDDRKKLFLTEYTKKDALEVTLLNRDLGGNALDNVRSFKYTPDPGAIGAGHGNDIPYLRLADIILARAEALNEDIGPNGESISLINEIRLRAKATLVNLGDFAAKEDLRDFILAERAKEFYTEGLRREDLIRHGKFIEQAVARGIDAKPYHVLYPFPNAQTENNPKLIQNDGY